MDYSSITEKDLAIRYNYSSSKLKAIFDSKETAVKVDRICADNHILADEKKIMVFQLTAMVLLGVLHIDDLASEIDHYLSLNNYKFSKAFAEEITKKIFEPVRAEIEKNYRPIANTSAQNLQTQSGAAAVKMTPAAPAAEKKPIPLGQLESKDAFAKPLTPPSFSPQPKPFTQTNPNVRPLMPLQRVTPTPPTASAANNFQSKNPPLDLSQKHAVATGMQPPAPRVVVKPAQIPPQLKPVEIKREVPVMPTKEAFGFGAEIQKLERAGNELVGVLKKREDKKLRYGGDMIEAKKEVPAPIQPAAVPLSAPKQGPVMIHQETSTQPIRPNVDFKLNFPQVHPIESFGQKGEIPKMAKIEIGGTTERQLEGMVKSPIIQPPKVVHYNAFQTPVDKPMPSFVQPSATLKPQVPSQTPLSQSPFVLTGKGLGDMRMEAPRPATPSMNSQKIRTVDFVTEGTPKEKPKRGWFASLFGKKERVEDKNTRDTMETQSRHDGNITASQTPARPIPPVPPTPPAPPRPQASNVNIQNIGNFVGTPKEQLSPVAPKTQDIKPQDSPMIDADIVDLNTMQKIKNRVQN